MNDSHHVLLERLSALPLVHDIIARLARELPRTLRYHSVDHTRDVLAEVIQFALHDGVRERDLELLAIAAAHHDAGYLERSADNEEIGAAMAADALRTAGGFSAAEIQTVEQMILSTQLLNGSTRIQYTPLAAYLMDADWGSFGRDDFFEKCRLLIEETGADPATFYPSSLRLVSTQYWLTPAAGTLRERKKQENIAALERIVNGTAQP